FELFGQKLNGITQLNNRQASGFGHRDTVVRIICLDGSKLLPHKAPTPMGPLGLLPLVETQRFRKPFSASLTFSSALPFNSSFFS
ncbi:hypothetical protein, partial [Vibrio vulnificus]|uniref:hypothetical protein n=1 Tax=Vibrio vulnificus TaxID=672 RepID=UPI0039B55B02